MEHQGDLGIAVAYGESQPDYGGIHFDGDQLIVRFTDDVDRHSRVLVERVDNTDLLTVRRSSRTWAEISESNLRVAHRLLKARPRFPGVNCVGIGMVDHEFVIYQADQVIVAR